MEQNEREIKFRAWNKNYKKMFFYPSWSTLHDSTVLVFEKEHEWVDESDYESNCILMQFTGLHDKNGLEIWEGDICKHAEDPSIFLVIFNDGSFRKKYKTWDKTIKFPYLEESDIKLLGIEVIGNIYETPELLSIK